MTTLSVAAQVKVPAIVYSLSLSLSLSLFSFLFFRGRDGSGGTHIVQ